MKWISIFGCFWTLFLCTFFLESTLAQEDYVALTEVDIYPASGPMIRQGTLLMKKGRIQAIGTHLPIPEKAKVYALPGKRVYPGLLLTNFTLSVSARGRLAENLDPYQDWVEFLLSVGITNAHTTIFRGNNNLGPHLSTVILNLNPKQPENFILAENVSVHLDSFFRSGRDFFELRQKLKQAHQRVREGLKPSPNLDIYAKLALKQIPARVRLNSQEDLQRLIRLVRETQIRVVVEGAEEGWILSKDLAREGIFPILFTRQTRAPYDPSKTAQGSSLRNAFLMYQSGVKFALSHPDPRINPWGTLNQDLLTFHLEPAFAIREGLSEEVALKSITCDAAEILGVAQELGDLRPGMRANLAVFSGNLFHYRSFCEMTFVDGTLVYEKENSTLYSQIPTK